MQTVEKHDISKTCTRKDMQNNIKESIQLFNRILIFLGGLLHATYVTRLKDIHYIISVEKIILHGNYRTKEDNYYNLDLTNKKGKSLSLRMQRISFNKKTFYIILIYNDLNKYISIKLIKFE